MSRLVVIFSILLGACGACSRSSGEPKQDRPATAAPEGGAPRAPGGADLPEGSGESFSLTLDQPDPVAAGAEAILRITVVPSAGYHINQDFPTKVTLEPPAGLKLAKTELKLADAEKVDDKQLVFAIAATPASAGSFTIPGKIKFAVCRGEEDCEPKRRPVSFTVAAQ
jgi:hypothetical protein